VTVAIGRPATELTGMLIDVSWEDEVAGGHGPVRGSSGYCPSFTPCLIGPREDRTHFEQAWHHT
jgi:hypothetical protein